MFDCEQSGKLIVLWLYSVFCSQFPLIRGKQFCEVQGIASVVCSSDLEPFEIYVKDSRFLRPVSSYRALNEIF